MKKFTTAVKENSENKYYSVEVSIILMVEATSEGEAGYKADDVFKGLDIPNMEHYQVVNIKNKNV